MNSEIDKDYHELCKQFFKAIRKCVITTPHPRCRLCSLLSIDDRIRNYKESCMIPHENKKENKKSYIQG